MHFGSFFVIEGNFNDIYMRSIIIFKQMKCMSEGIEWVI